ncbi:MAG: glutamyl-tRNA reductase [Verrucomicrobiota bacterium]|jgi:glutamyl-tRNA reductase
MNVIVIGLSHHSSPVELRERFAFAEAKIPDALKSLRASGIADEAVILSTCNRVEIYAATTLEPARAFVELKQFLAKWGETTGEPSVEDNSGSRGRTPHQSDIHAQCSSPSPRRGEGRGEEAVSSSSDPRTPALSPLGRGEGVERVGSSRRDDRTARRAIPTEIGDEFYTLCEPQSLQHLFKVACGLDSMVLGETEILGQLKKAYDLAFRHRHTGARLNKAFQRAFHVAKHIRTETNIQRGSVSVASVAVELAEKIFSSLNDREVLVIGAGETSEKTARALLSRGARSIIVANRSHDRAVALANELGGRAVQFDDWAGEFQKIDIAISSTSAPHHILDRARLEPLLKLRHHRPLLLIDIAVPRDIDPEVNFLENVYLYNIDDLQAIADDYLKQRREEVARCEQIIAEKVKGLLDAKRFQPRMDTDEHGFEIAGADVRRLQGQ